MSMAECLGKNSKNLKCLNLVFSQTIMVFLKK